MRYRVTIIFSVLLLAGVAALYLLGREQIQAQRRPTSGAASLDDRARLETVWLYYGSVASAALERERRTIASGPSLEERISACIDELARGSLEGRISVLPTNTRLRRAFLDPWGVAYLDFDGAIRRGRLPGDGEEWLAVGAVVRTVCDNFPEVSAIRFMIDGDVITTLGGYIDLEEPISAEQFPDQALSR